MKTSDKKLLKIIDVFYTYCFYVGGKNIDVKTKLENNIFSATIKSDFDLKYLDLIQSLEEKLNKPRNPSMEAMYWNVVGNTEFQDDNDIYVVGSMIDTADIIIQENHFEIRLTRAK